MQYWGDQMFGVIGVGVVLFGMAAVIIAKQLR